MEILNIAGRAIGPGEPPYIIAEIGSNHNGDMSLCRELIDAAAGCKVDAVKFQSWSKRSLISEPEYRRNNRYANSGTPTLEQAVEKYQLTPEQHCEVAAYCRKTGVTMFSSCFAPEEVDLLDQLGVPAFKIASMDVNHLPLLEYVAARGKPVILSTGLATLGEIERAASILRGPAGLVLLHCVSIYPSPPDQVHLRNMDTLRRAFDLPVGYSDHSLGTAIPLAAVALGAVMIEKHFTVDKKLDGWDHAVSADPPEMEHLVREGRNIVAALGSAQRTLNESQMEKRKVFRRRVVLRRALEQGERIAAGDLDYKRPGTGIGPDEAKYVVGRIAGHSIDAEAELEWRDLV